MLQDAVNETLDDRTKPSPPPRAESEMSRLPIDPAMFDLLLGRIEQLSRELGRAEGQQLALTRHVARLEEQLARLRGDERGAAND